MYEKYGFKRIQVEKFQAERCDQAWLFDLTSTKTNEEEEKR